MKTEQMKISLIKGNPDNPRLIKDEAFAKLVKSIHDFPEMLDIRPIVINKGNVILGGNMRWKAATEAGLKTVPVIRVDFTLEKEREFVIKDNVSGGEWDWQKLQEEWNSEELTEWGLPVFIPSEQNLDEFFNGETPTKKEKNTITLEFSDEDFPDVLEAFGRHSGSRESVVMKLLGLS